MRSPCTATREWSLLTATRERPVPQPKSSTAKKKKKKIKLYLKKLQNLHLKKGRWSGDTDFEAINCTRLGGWHESLMAPHPLRLITIMLSG